MTIECKQKKHGKPQRRKVFRVFYPQKMHAEITTLKAKVIDISIKSMRFKISNATKYKITHPGSKWKFQVKCHDGQTFEVVGVISSRLDPHKGVVYICIFEKEISSEIIAKEGAYLLKHFQNFCIMKYQESL